MQLVEQHIIGKSHKDYKILDEALFKSKNLYNATLYYVRQSFINEGKYTPYATLQNKFQTENQFDYRELPSKVSQQTMKLVDQNFRAFFKAIKAYASDKSKFTGRPKLPRYLDKKKGRCVLTYTSQAISKKHFEEHSEILFSGLDVRVKTDIKFEDINQVRIVPRNNRIIVEVVYTAKDVLEKEDNGNYAAIDLGLDNLATVTSNVKNFKPFIINGKPLKSVNHYYNKKKAELQAELARCNGNKKTSNEIKRLTNVRNNKIKDYLHKASRMIVNQLVSFEINTLVIGKNKGWKQDINIGRVNNQNFVQIPFDMLIDMLKYKCKLEGISVKIIDESYTSKCSFLDNESIEKHNEYAGKRVHRGLFKTKGGILINADVNASYNILRKCKPNAFRKNLNGVMGLLVVPVVFTVSKTSRKPLKRDKTEGEIHQFSSKV